MSYKDHLDYAEMGIFAGYMENEGDQVKDRDQTKRIAFSPEEVAIMLLALDIARDQAISNASFAHVQNDEESYTKFLTDAVEIGRLHERLQGV
jgi:hypothetical protein